VDVTTVFVTHLSQRLGGHPGPSSRARRHTVATSTSPMEPLGSILRASAASRSYGVRLAAQPCYFQVEVQHVVLRWGFKITRQSPPGWQMIYKKEPGRSKTRLLFAALGSSCSYAGEQTRCIIVRRRTSSKLQLGLLPL
jgi:hypothetical protein